MTAHAGIGGDCIGGTHNCSSAELNPITDPRKWVDDRGKGITGGGYDAGDQLMSYWSCAHSNQHSYARMGLEPRGTAENWVPVNCMTCACLVIIDPPKNRNRAA